VADPRPLLRELARVDRPGAVWCAVLCATSVAHLVPPEERRPGRARLLAAAWAVGLPVSEARLRAAGYAAARAASDAAYAAAYATGAAFYRRPASHAEAAAAVSRRPAARAATVRDRHLAALHDLVVHQTTPVSPTPRDVAAARPAVAVVWDAAAEAVGPVRLGTLGDALARARRLRLRWHDPVERAIAERLPEDHPALDALRRARRG
jgi:hypothetical protein